MIQITLNDKPITLKKNDSLLTLLEKQDYEQDCYAVALNHHFVPRSQYQTTLLKNNDVVDIIMPMQGG